MQNKVTNSQMAAIKDFIMKELLKRGFHVEMKEFDLVKKNSRPSEIIPKSGTEEMDPVNCRFQFRTTTFQTTPVLFERLSVTDFSSNINNGTIGDDEKPCLNVHITVCAQHTNFDSGGTNMITLFGFKCKLFKGEVFQMSTY